MSYHLHKFTCPGLLAPRDRTIRQWTIRQWKIRQWTMRQWSDNPSVDNPSVNRFVIPTHTQTTAAKYFSSFVWKIIRDIENLEK